MLQLVLKGKWFDMIERGEKPEEYRSFNKYWQDRILTSDVPLENDRARIAPPVGVQYIVMESRWKHKTVRLRHGYGRGAREMVFRIAGLRFGTPLPGMAEGEGPYLCIRLGERLK